MRVNMDSSIATDPRFKLLASDLGISRNELAGALFYMWLACYERRSPRLSKRLADASAEIVGFSNALVEAELADDDDDAIIVHGAEIRIKFLLTQAEKGRKGGQKGKGKPKVKAPKAGAKRGLSEAKAKPKQSQSKATAYSPTLTQSLTPANGVELLARGAIDHLNSKLGTKSRVGKSVLANVRALAKDYELEDFRAVIDAKISEWGQDPEMAKYLRPSTLFRPSKFRGYVDDLGATAPQVTLEWRDDEEPKT